ncbi:MAG: hypothetical protein V1695_01545 [Candidatus Uhrbacteria bacterium]
MGNLVHLDGYFRDCFQQIFGKELPGYEHLVNYLVSALRSANVNQTVVQELVKALFHAFEEKGIVSVSPEAVERLGVLDQPEAMRRLKLHTRTCYDMHFSQTMMAFYLHLAQTGYKPTKRQSADLYNIWTVIYAMFAGYEYDPQQEEETSSTADA